MSAKEKRLGADIAKIKALAAKSIGGIKIVSTTNSRISLELNYKTVADNSGKIASTIVTEIQIPDRYPFVEPKAIFKNKVFHPNVYSSGQVCLGTKWIPTEGLDLLLERLIKILIFDATILNTKSPANTEALSWYRTKVRSAPNFFPTDTFVKNSTSTTKSGIKWKNSPAQNSPDRIVSCHSCGQKIRLSSSGGGTIKCPKCQKTFMVEG